MDPILYPIFYPIKYRRVILPNIRLPQDFRELVPRFYEQGRQQTIEEYARNVRSVLERDPTGKLIEHPEIILNWDKKSGLKKIEIGPASLYLVDALGSSPHFHEYNLGTHDGYVTGIIAMAYVSELLKSKYE